MRKIELDNEDVVKRILDSIINVIRRRSSEDYAMVMLGNTIKKVQENYGFLSYITVKNTRYSEMENILNIDSDINNINSEDLGKALQEIIGSIVISMGKNAGFFFIKEIKNKIGANYALMIRKMGVDLDFMQFNFEVDKKQTNKLTIENSDVFYRVLKILIEIIDKEIGKSFSIQLIKKIIKKYSDKYDFLKNVNIIDIRYTLGEKEIDIRQDINKLEPTHIGNAIEDIFIEIQVSLGEKNKSLNIDDFKRQLTLDYRKKLVEMEIDLKKKKFENSLVLKYVIQALVEVLSKASTKRYAIFAINSVIRKIDNDYDFIKNINITPNESNDLCSINITSNIDDISETDIRRSIQKLLVDIIDSIGEELGGRFITEFKNSLEKNCLLQIEEMGVNLHMVQLRQEILGKI